jgi:hypothetical protein
LLVLWEGYDAFYGREANTKLTAEVVKMTWSRFFDSYEPMHALVAERSPLNVQGMLQVDVMSPAECTAELL